MSAAGKGIASNKLTRMYLPNTHNERLDNLYTGFTTYYPERNRTSTKLTGSRSDLMPTDYEVSAMPFDTEQEMLKID